MLKEKIQNDLKENLKAGNKEAVSALRMLFSEIKNTEIQKQKKDGLSEDEIIEVVLREVKKRKDSIRQYREGGRKDLAEQEEKELEILTGYMPEQLGEDEIKKIAQEIIGKINASGKSDFGKVMGAMMKEVKGKTDGALVGKVVKELLESN
jgi:uncharacterized protein YqeY